MQQINPVWQTVGVVVQEEFHSGQLRHTNQEDEDQDTTDEWIKT